MFLWLEPVHQYTPSKGPGMSLHESVRRTHPHWLEESITDLPISVKKKESVFMNKKTQDALDAQIQKKRAAQVVEVSEAPTLTSEIFERDARTEARVEVNFKDESARLVETSDAPKLTRDVLETKGKPIKTVEMFFEDQMWQVKIRDGKSLSVEVAHLKLLMEYADSEGDRAAMEERDRVIANLLLGKMMADPVFSYKGEGEGPPIEERSSIMIEALCNAFAEVNNPTADEIYQVTVRRGIPADAFAMFGESFEWYPVGGKQKKYVEMSEDELAAAEARNAAQRQVLVAKMIVDPVLSYTPVPDDDPEGYPVELLSERYMKTLHEAHRVVNIPEAGLKSLQQFLRASDRDEKRTEASGKSVGE